MEKIIIFCLIFSVSRISLQTKLTRQDCPEGYVQCENGYNWRQLREQSEYTDCVSNSTVCDGNFDCSDTSDEKYCSHLYNLGYNGFVHYLISGPCKPDEFICQRTNSYSAGRRYVNCNPRDQICNNRSGCYDNSDEKFCPHGNKGFHFEFTQEDCPKYQFKCPDENSNKCITKWQICNGKPDCADRSDSSDEYYCPYLFAEDNLDGKENYSIRDLEKMAEDLKSLMLYLEEAFENLKRSP